MMFKRKTFAITFIAVTMAGLMWLLASTRSADLGAWHLSVSEASVAAGSSNRPVLAFFSTDWCGPCKLFKRVTLTGDGVMEYVAEHFEAAYIDLTDSQSRFQADGEKYDIWEIPTLMVIDSKGMVIARHKLWGKLWGQSKGTE